jgi:hypothetical protein
MAITFGCIEGGRTSLATNEREQQIPLPLYLQCGPSTSTNQAPQAQELELIEKVELRPYLYV